jgi:hypothetical protein
LSEFHRYSMNQCEAATGGKPARYRIYGYKMFDGHELQVGVDALYLCDIPFSDLQARVVQLRDECRAAASESPMLAWVYSVFADRLDELLSAGDGRTS